MDNKEIVLIGAGGHCKSVIDIIERQGKYKIFGIVDRAEQAGSEVCGYKVLYNDSDLINIYNRGIRYAAITIAGVGDFTIRKKLYDNAYYLGFEFPVICDRSAVVSKYAKVGNGVFIGKNAVVNACAVINDMAIINTSAIIEHDCYVDFFGSIAPGCVLSGGAVVGKFSHIGSGSVLIQNINIGDYSIIGAGSVVVKDIPSNTKAYGVPCKIVKKDNVKGI